MEREITDFFWFGTDFVLRETDLNQLDSDYSIQSFFTNLMKLILLKTFSKTTLVTRNGTKARYLF